MTVRSRVHARSCMAAVTALMLLSTGSPASATDLADPFMSVTAYMGGFEHAGTTTFTGCDALVGSCGTVSASVFYSGGFGLASVEGHFDSGTHDASPDAPRTFGMGSMSNLWFEIVVDGPCFSDGDGGCLGIPVITTVSGHASATGTMASAAITTPGGTLVACAGFLLTPDGAPFIDCGDKPSSFSGTTTGTLQPGRPDVIHMSAVGGGKNFIYTAASYLATVDPMVVIDPSFAYKDLYTLSVSQDPAGMVPEPASVVLLGAGLLALLGRKRVFQAIAS